MENSITHFIARAKETDEQAAAQIWDKYFERLAAYARRKLSAMPRKAVDEEDVVLSAMNSFFIGARAGRFEPKDRDELWKLLATITVRKATAQLRKHYAQKRGGGEVRGESIFHRAGHQAGEFGIDDILDEKRLPEMSMQLMITCEERLNQLPDETFRQIAIMRMEGHENLEIAEKLNISLATVKRKLKKTRELWAGTENGD